MIRLDYMDKLVTTANLSKHLQKFLSIYSAKSLRYICVSRIFSRFVKYYEFINDTACLNACCNFSDALLYCNFRLSAYNTCL